MSVFERCPARFVEDNGRWYKCILNLDGHSDHIALLHGKTSDADIRWHRPFVLLGEGHNAQTAQSKGDER